MPNNRFYHSRAWKRLRLRALARDHWYCQPCRRRGKPFVPANTVHHLVPVDEAPQLALKLSNVESLCPACHNKEHPEKSFRKKKKTGARPAVRIIKM